MKTPCRDRIPHGFTAAVIVLCALSQVSPAADVVQAKDGSGVYGYNDTPVLPWCKFRVHDADRPAPPRVDPGPPTEPAPAPADAIVLFDGKDASKWQGDCKVDAGNLVAGKGPLTTREEFGDIQIHLEWMAPAGFEGPWYNRGNNGLDLMGLYEIQIFDSFNEKIYPDGQAAAVYAQTPPLVNVTRPPGQWQSYDIIFTAPRFEGDTLLAPARVTMLHNGVLVHLDQVIHGETKHRGLPAYNQKKSTGPLVLSGHDCPVRFRNIWVRKLGK